MTLRRSAFLVAAGLLALAACSSDDDTASDDTVAAAMSTAATTAAPTTTSPTTVPASTSPPTTADADVAEWCVVAAEVDELSDQSDLVDYTDPDEVEAYLDELVPALEAAAGQAPDEIADAVATSADIAGRLRDALVEVDYDMLVADLSLVDELDDERSAAQDEIRRFNAEQCGIEFDEEETATAADDDFSFSDGSLRDQFINELVDSGFTLAEAACIFQELDFADADSMNDPEQLGPVFDTCGISFERLEEIGAASNPELGSTDLLATSLATAGLDDEQIACVVDAVEAMPASEVDEDAIIEIMLDCGVGIDQITDPGLSSAADLEAAFIDQFEAMGMSRADAQCLYDELIVGNIDGFEADDVLGAMENCGIDPVALG